MERPKSSRKRRMIEKLQNEVAAKRRLLLQAQDLNLRLKDLCERRHGPGAALAAYQAEGGNEELPLNTSSSSESSSGEETSDCTPTHSSESSKNSSSEDSEDSEISTSESATDTESDSDSSTAGEAPKEGQNK